MATDQITAIKPRRPAISTFSYVALIVDETLIHLNIMATVGCNTRYTGIKEVSHPTSLYAFAIHEMNIISIHTRVYCARAYAI